MFIAGLPTVWYHGFGETFILGFFDIGTNLLFGWALVNAGLAHPGPDHCYLVTLMFVIGALLATASNQRVDFQILAWHAPHGTSWAHLASARCGRSITCGS